jgi:hypothetical protein
MAEYDGFRGPFPTNIITAILLSKGKDRRAIGTSDISSAKGRDYGYSDKDLNGHNGLHLH